MSTRGVFVTVFAAVYAVLYVAAVYYNWALFTYAPATDRYLGEITCSDITAQQGKAAVIRSRLDLSLEAARDAAKR